MDTKIKRKRSENWDSTDKLLLRQLIEEKIQIIENKSVDTNTSKQKRIAWKEILDSFNICSTLKRDVTQIQTQWRTCKMKAKLNASAYKKSRIATGGGTPPKSPDPEDARLMALIPQEFEIDSNAFDCDAPDILDEIIENTDETTVVCEGSSMNQTKTDEPSTKKKGGKGKPRSLFNENNDEMKIELFEMVKKTKVREMELLEIEHKERMKIIQLDWEHKKRAYETDERHKEQEHQLRMAKISQQQPQ